MPGDLTPEAADQLVLDVLAERVSVYDITLPRSRELSRAIERYRQRRIAVNNSHSQTQSADLGPSRVQAIMANSQRERLERMINVLDESLEALEEQLPLEAPSPPPWVGPGEASRSWQPPARRARRPPLAESTRYLERQRQLAQSRTAELRDARERFHSMNERMRSSERRNEYMATLSGPPTAREYAGEAEVNSAAKRRKVDGGEFTSSYSGFPPYGHYGQVEPGKLNMQIYSCDGGMLVGNGGKKYAAENVLLNDKSVYCSKGNRCNLVLQHQGGTPFTITELIIKAPPRGYTAPIQEGMVFVSMTSDDLLNRTASYQIQYSPSKTRRRPSIGSSSTTPPHRPTIISIRHNDDGTENITRITDYRHTISRPDSPSSDDASTSRQAQIPDAFTHESQPGFNITCDCSDDDEDDENSNGDGTHPLRRSSRRTPGSRRFESNPSEESDDEEQVWPADDLLFGGGAERQDDNPRLSPRGYERRSEASHFSISADLEAAQDAAQEATQEALKAVTGSSGLMSPLCKFFIDRDKSKITIRFSPEVSGRFILLKLWSPIHERGGNIDVQNVSVKGFAGGRYFPSARMR